MKFDEEGQCWVIEHPWDFANWNILNVEKWKCGVRRINVAFYSEELNVCRTCFCDRKILIEYKRRRKYYDNYLRNKEIG